MDDDHSLKYWAQKVTAKRQQPNRERGDTINVQFRLHTELYDMLVNAAGDNYRSVNGEIAYRLLKSFDKNGLTTEENVK